MNELRRPTGSPPNRGRDSRRAEAMEFIRKLEEQMPEANKTAYFKLKEWRAMKAGSAKAPVFSIANNRQLAELALRAPSTKAGIREIQGLGEMFCKNYADDVIGILAGLKGVEYTMPTKGTYEEGSSMINSEEDNLQKDNLSTRTREERQAQ